MDAKYDAIQSWFFECFAGNLASVFEALTAAPPSVRWEPLAGPVERPGHRWKQDFGDVAGSAWMIAGERDWSETARLILAAGGKPDPDADSLRSAYGETLGRAFSGIAQGLSGRLGREITCARGEESTGAIGAARWATIHVQAGSLAVLFSAAVEERLLESLVKENFPAKAPAQAAPDASAKTFDLLLDVELPVSVSFGRAQVPLKDVIKLTVGSIVELNRSIAEPVEVIVNNCVIARGEVVVVEGNFGVRIQEVISRQDRLRTLT